ncbi:MAG TPA: hypothetical protein VFZ26_09785 [Gemmatimonadales bacterium]
MLAGPWWHPRLRAPFLLRPRCILAPSFPRPGVALAGMEPPIRYGVVPGGAEQVMVPPPLRSGSHHVVRVYR